MLNHMIYIEMHINHRARLQIEKIVKIKESKEKVLNIIHIDQQVNM